MKQERIYRLAAIVVSSLVVIGCGTQARNADKDSVSTQRSANQPVTDAAIDADYKAYGKQQLAIKAVNDTGRAPVGSYALAKSQCWLDVSLHEYSRNDRSNFPKLAYIESSKITQELMASGQSASAASTPLINGAAKLRPDLWDAANALKKHAGFACIQQAVACAEVELVHAGNEFNQFQWQHAKPYIQIAEDLLDAASKRAPTCVPVVAVAPPPPPPAPPPPPPPAPLAPRVAPVIQPVSLAANVLFNFDKRTMDQARRFSVDQLDAVIAQSKNIKITRVELAGHADREKSARDNAYNDKLSMDRVNAVRQYMQQRGVDLKDARVIFKGDSEQIEACSQEKNQAKFRSIEEVRECLLPNRRVTVLVEGQR